MPYEIQNTLKNDPKMVKNDQISLKIDHFYRFQDISDLNKTHKKGNEMPNRISVFPHFQENSKKGPFFFNQL